MRYGISFMQHTIYKGFLSRLSIFLILFLVLISLCQSIGASPVVWNTFLGSEIDDRARGIAIDGSGDLYVAGLSSTTWGDSPVRDHAGGRRDGFVAKLNSSGVRQWNTFLGSGGFDSAQAIAVYDSDNSDDVYVYITGESDATWDSPVNPHAGGLDALVAKLNSSGDLQWHTFLGSGSNESSNGITVDSSGDIYIIGQSYATWDSPVNPHAGGIDVFVAKLDGNSGDVQWHTFLGSGSKDWGYEIAVDDSGTVYVTGISESTWGTPVNPHAGGTDAFVAKLDGSSGILQWNTFLGSGTTDSGYGITVDGSGTVYASGSSAATWGSSVNPHAGGSRDAFIAKLNSSGVVQWNTFLGSGSEDSGWGITVDGSGNVYTSGSSDTTWGSPVNPHAGGGPKDAFVAKLNSSGVLQRNTFLGSVSEDTGGAIVVDGSGNVCVIGQSQANWGTPINPHAGGLYNVFVAKLDSDLSAPTPEASKDITGGEDRLPGTPIFDVFAGDIFTYTIEFENPFAQAVYVIVRDTLDAALDYVLGSFTVDDTPAGDGAFNNDELMYTDHWLDVGESLSLTFEVEVQDVPVGTLIDNTAWITAYTNPSNIPGTTLAEIEAIAPQAHVVPEPSTLFLFGIGLVGISGLVWRKLKKYGHYRMEREV